jgi:hypothetical protein
MVGRSGQRVTHQQNIQKSFGILAMFNVAKTLVREGQQNSYSSLHSDSA